jgi:hypothetical protein
MSKRASILLAGLLIAALPALAGEAAGGVTWDALDEDVRTLLAGQEERWASLTPERQHAMAEGAKRWLAMDGIGRAQANERWQTWRSLTPAQRERLRKGWARFRELTPEQQDALRGAYRRFRSMPPEQRDNLRERWEQMSPEERRRAIQRRQGARPGSIDKRPCPHRSSARTTGSLPGYAAGWPPGSAGDPTACASPTWSSRS